MLYMSWFLDQMCILMGFINFRKDFEKFWKSADFWPKNDHFARIARRFFGTRFSTENVSSLWKMLISPPNLLYIYPKVSSTITRFQIYHISSVSWVLGHLVHQGVGVSPIYRLPIYRADIGRFSEYRLSADIADFGRYFGRYF